MKVSITLECGDPDEAKKVLDVIRHGMAVPMTREEALAIVNNHASAVPTPIENDVATPPDIPKELKNSTSTIQAPEDFSEEVMSAKTFRKLVRKLESMGCDDADKIEAACGKLMQAGHPALDKVVNLRERIESTIG